jgi:uncharacterized protein
MFIETRAERFVFGFLILALIFGFSVLSNKNASNCRESYSRDQVVRTGNDRIDVQVADTNAELATGLGGKACISDNQGMLFKLEKPGIYEFWMKDMKFSIDIIWIDSNRKIVHIEKNVTPSSYPQTYKNNVAAMDILELKANRSSELDLEIGTQLSY